MNLADRVARCQDPFLVHDYGSGRILRLNSAADCAAVVARCRHRYVLADGVTRLCGDLAFGSVSSPVVDADLIRLAEGSIWIEWGAAPWQDALRRHGIPAAVSEAEPWSGRRGGGGGGGVGGGGRGGGGR
jgi:hypothetical protein